MSQRKRSSRKKRESSILKAQSSAGSASSSKKGPKIIVNNELITDADIDSPGTKMLKSFRKVDYSNARVVALNDSKEYAPFKKEDEMLRQLQEKEAGTFVPKGNPYRVSKISEVILVKERREAEIAKLTSQLSRKSSLSNHSRKRGKVAKSQNFSQALTKMDSGPRKVLDTSQFSSSD